jgi:HD superfamily phosphohydrolase
MELASAIFDRVLLKPSFSLKIEEREYWRQIVRLAALCHDLGHLPFSHVAEKALLGKEGHEKWTLKIIQSRHLKPVWDLVEKAFPNHDVTSDVIKISIGQKKLEEIAPGVYFFSPWEKVVSQMISADFFGADRIDYLLRDAQCTGVAYGLFDYHQLIEMLCILPCNEGWELGIEENGVESCEALLLARHFMHKRVYQYSSVKAYAFHLIRFMLQMFPNVKDDIDEYLAFTENEVLASLNASAKLGTGHKDAFSLMRRERRFKAIALTPALDESLLQGLKERASIPDEAISWDLNKHKKKPVGLSFPVLKKNQKILDASLCSNILIPLETTSWVFVAPEYERALSDLLEKA